MEFVMPSRSTLTAVLGRMLWSGVAGITIGIMALGNPIIARAAGAAETPSQAGSKEASLGAAELEELVGPIALYPDELLAIVLPASTYPLQIVQAARFLEKRKADSELEPDEEWDPSVLGLLNYPEVIDLMNTDLNWTWKLGDAVAYQQEDVLDAIQAFRAKVDEAGNLEFGDKMSVVKETEEGQQVIVIESASPEVIYVPTYQPTTVVVYQTAPYPYYYSPPYPYYYRPAAVFWTGLFLGAAVGYGLRWGGGRRRGNIDIDRHVNVNVNNKNVSGNRVGSGNSQKWQSDSGRGKPGGGRPGGPSNRPGTGPGTGPGDRPGTKPGTGPGNRPGGGPGERPGTKPGSRPGDAAGSRPETRPSGRDPSGASGREQANRSSQRQGSGRDLTSPSSQRTARDSSMGSYDRGSSSRSQSSRGSSSRGGGRGGGGRRGGGGGRR
jgi:hypothetical protein